MMEINYQDILKRNYKTVLLSLSHVLFLFLVFWYIANKASKTSATHLSANIDQIRMTFWVLSICVVVSIPWAKKMLLNLKKKKSLENQISDKQFFINKLFLSTIFGIGACEIPAIWGMVVTLSSHDMSDFFKMSGLSVVMLLFNWPKFSKWQDEYRLRFGCDEGFEHIAEAEGIENFGKVDPSVNPKEPLLSVLLNVFLPGLGYWYVNQKNKAVIVWGGMIFLLYVFFGFVLHPIADLRSVLCLPVSSSVLFGAGILPVAFVLAIQIFIIIDGYKIAKKYNVNYNVERKISGWKRAVYVVGIVVSLLGLNVGTLLAHYIRLNVVQAFYVPSGAMRMTLLQGDRFLANKRIYKQQKPQRGDIIVFKYPNDPTRDFVKRVIAVGGEKVEIKLGQILINDVPISEDFIGENYYYNRGEYGKEGGAIIVPKGCYYVLGDNSASSFDSRDWGFVPEENIIGKAYKIYWPIERSGPIDGGCVRNSKKLSNIPSIKSNELKILSEKILLESKPIYSDPAEFTREGSAPMTMGELNKMLKEE